MITSQILIAIILSCQINDGKTAQKDCREALIKCVKEDMTRGYEEEESLVKCFGKQ